jgi:hypothetical protein
MRLSEGGEARVRGYLFVLGRALKSSLPEETAMDALREIQSHIRERVEEAQAVPSEEAALERVLAEFGSPLQVAQAYSVEMEVAAAVAHGGLGAVIRALWRLATTTISGFVGSLVLFLGYATGVGFVALAVIKLLFPGNVGLIVVNGIPRAFGAEFPLPPGAEVYGGYWVLPVSLAVGLAVLVLTHRLARHFLSWWMARVSPQGPRALP